MRTVLLDGSHEGDDTSALVAEAVAEALLAAGGLFLYLAAAQATGAPIV